MNLLEFKRFCLKRQNYDYVFVKIESDHDLSIGPAVIEKPEAKLVTVKYNDTFNISPYLNVVDSLRIGNKIDQRLNLSSGINVVDFKNTSVKMNQFVNVSKLGLYVDNSVNVSLSKDFIQMKTRLSASSKDSVKGSLINDLLLENKLKAVIADAIDIITQLPQKIEIKAGANIAEPLEMNVISNNQIDFITKVNTAESNKINIGNLDSTKFESNILNTDGNEVNSTTNPIMGTYGGFNVARKAYLSDYSNDTLKDMVDKYVVKETTLYQLNYYIIQ